MSRPTSNDRLLTPLRELIRAEVSRLSYLGTWEYTVTGVNGAGAGATVNATATSDRAPLPSLMNVPIRSGPEGGVGEPTGGQLCYVRFINADPSRPIVVGNQPVVKNVTIDATDTVAIGPSSKTVILAGGEAPTARMGDACQVYFPTSPMPCAGATTLPPGAFVGTVTFTAPGTATIMTGQPKVLA